MEYAPEATGTLEVASAYRAPVEQSPPNELTLFYPGTEEASPESDPTFEQLFTNNYARLLCLLENRLRGDLDDKEDLCQETFLKLWRGMQTGKVRTNEVQPWLWVVARNASIDAHRRRTSTTAPPLSLYREPPDVASDVDTAETVANRRLVLDGLAQLSQTHREVLVGQFYFGLTKPELSKWLGVPEGTISSRRHYAMIALRKIILGQSAPEQPLESNDQ